MDELNAIEIEKGFRILTYDGTLEFNVVGFIAKIATAMAKRGVPVFVISAYSTDHILIKDHDVGKAIEALKELEFEVVGKDINIEK